LIITYLYGKSFLAMKFRFEYRIVLAYLILGGLWILFSDRLVYSIFGDSWLISRVQTYKGWFYVVTTGILFFFILRKYIMGMRKATLKAQESDRLKTAFLQNVSHELRTPMNAICGFSDLLKRQNLTTEKRDAYIDIIVNNSNQLLAMVNDVLTLSNIETQQEKVYEGNVDVSEIVEKAYNHFLPLAAAKGIALSIQSSHSKGNTLVKTDGEKLKQILWNLLSNAVKFTDTGSITIRFDLSYGQLYLSVSDTGIGIDTDEQEIVFNRFVQANPSIALKYGGTGLGLTIAKALCELMGGEIKLTSKISQGTTVSLSIPTKQTISSNNAQKHLGKNEQYSQIILIAEDEDFNYLYLEELLKSTNLKLLRARNGQEAVDICSDHQQVDIVIMDIKMPLMNGYEATKLIKKLRPSLPIIAQTAYASPADEDRLRKVGVDEYLSKPIDSQKLLSLLHRYGSISKAE